MDILLSLVIEILPSWHLTALSLAILVTTAAPLGTCINRTNHWRKKSLCHKTVAAYRAA